ncbi:hypothetical protein BDN71DRAFT_1188592 [Pleurotus eryngii]|uniref:DUF6533 domain-containing protein n=1 Tax=Pleurotus eryngii TaxID=5323 RepID=A0A9P6DJA5_PLEER|nr:hypothetical protein BDN71DRAFT_1188592 [Pleurotus eryngii]
MDFPPELIASLSWNQQSTYLPIAGAGLFIYDYVLTLGDEARHVWTAPWSLGKILFLLTRYPTFIDVALALYRNLGYNLTSGTCSILYNISGWTTIIGIAIAEIIMLMRVWAIWNQTRTFHEKQEFIELYTISPNLQGCYGTVGTKVVFIVYVIATVFEILMVILMTVKGLRDSVRRHSSSMLYNVYQDGILYYVVLSGSSIANTVLILAGPTEFTNALSMVQRSFHSILSARILLRLREDASQRQHLVTYTQSLGESFFDGVHEPGVRRQGKETTNWFGDAYSYCHVVDVQAPPARDAFNPT